MATDDIVISKDFAEFMAALHEQSVADYTYTTNAVIEFETARADRAETALAMARDAIMGMLDGPYMPTSAAIERALYPSWEAVEAERKHRAAGG